MFKSEIRRLVKEDHGPRVASLGRLGRQTLSGTATVTAPPPTALPLPEHGGDASCAPCKDGGGEEFSPLPPHASPFSSGRRVRARVGLSMVVSMQRAEAHVVMLVAAGCRASSACAPACQHVLPLARSPRAATALSMLSPDLQGPFSSTASFN